MDEFMPGLIQHLSDEIETLRPEKIEKVGKAAEDELRVVVTKHLQEYEPSWFLCCVFSELRQSEVYACTLGTDEPCSHYPDDIIEAIDTPSISHSETIRACECLLEFE